MSTKDTGGHKFVHVEHYFADSPAESESVRGGQVSAVATAFMYVKIVVRDLNKYTT